MLDKMVATKAVEVEGVVSMGTNVLAVPKEA